MRKLSDHDKTGKLEDVFRNNFNKAEAEPSGHIWQALDQQLEAGSGKAGGFNWKWVRYVSVACLLFLIGVWVGHSELFNEQQQSVIVNQKQNFEVDRSTKVRGSEINENNALSQVADNPENSFSQHFSEKELKNGSDRASGPVEEKSKNGLPDLHVEHSAILPSENSKNNQIPVLAVNSKNYHPASSRPGQPKENSRNAEVELPSENKPAKKASGNITQADKSDQIKSNFISDLPSDEEPFLSRISQNQLKNDVESINMLSFRDVDPDTALAKPLLPALPQPDSVALPVMLAKQVSRWEVRAMAGVQHLAPKFREKKVSGDLNPASLITVMPGSGSDVISEMNNTETSFTHQAEILIAYKLHKHWKLESGINYTGYQFTSKQTYMYQEIKEPSGIGSSTVREEGFTTAAYPYLIQGDFSDTKYEIKQGAVTDITYSFQYMGIPLNIVYQQSGYPWGYEFGAGLTLQYLLRKNNDREILPAPKVIAADIYNKWQLQAGAFATATYQLHPGLKLTAGPVFNYGLRSMLKENDYNWKVNPVSVGLSAGMIYQFNKK